MAGDIFYMVSAAEVKDLKKSPERVWEYDRMKRRHVDLEIMGFQIDLALDRLGEEMGEPCLAEAVNGGQDIGSGGVMLRFLPARAVKEIARALAGIDRDMFNKGLCLAFGVCDDLDQICFPRFQDLAEFYQDAAKSRKAVVKTIY